MTCSITIIRRGKPVAEVKGVDVGEPLYDPREVIAKHINSSMSYAECMELAELIELRDEVEAAEIVPHVPDEEFEINVESTLLDLYEKIGILKERIERLENERRD